MIFEDNKFQGKRAAIYPRLSKDDGRTGESDSMQSQKKMCAEYALKRQMKIVDIYDEDDGISGLTDQRPGFQRMLRDIRAGKIDVVLCKDQSRFSRDNSLIDKLVFQEFPSLGVTFIGITDCADSSNRGQKKVMQINGLNNEWYSEDISVKVRSAYEVKKRDGKYLGSHPPYGYLKNTDNKYELIVDESVRWVINLIYDKYLEGWGYRKIAALINELGEPNPIEHMRQIGINLKNPYDYLEHIPGWSLYQVARILKSSTYAGILYQDVYENISYKIQKKKKRPMEEWVPIEVPAIIDKEKWELVQSQVSQRRKNAEDTTGISMYSRTERRTKYGGLLRCGDCGRALTYNEVRWYKGIGRRGDRYHPNYNKIKMVKQQYTCITYRQKSSKACTNHNITIDELDEMVLGYVKELSKAALDVDFLVKELEAKQKTEVALDYLGSRIAAKEKRIREINKLHDTLYEDWRVRNLIDEADYVRMRQGYIAEKERLQQELENLNNEKAKHGDKLDYDVNWRKKILQYQDLKEVTRPFLLNFIDYIEVFKDKRILFHLKINNPFLSFDEYLSSLKEQNLEPTTIQYLAAAQAAVRAKEERDV